MSDIIFNEMSIDFSYSNAPGSEQDALEVLKKFIDNCLAYSLASGTKVFVREYGNMSGDSVNLSTTNFWQHDNIYALLKELGEQGELKDEEITRFKQMMAEISNVDVDPEYTYNAKEVFGLGKAFEEESYVVSLLTHDDWENKQVTNVQKVTVTPVYAISPCAAIDNISTLSHVFVEHSIWNSCEYKHIKPKDDYFLPKTKQSEYIPQAFKCSGWDDFYTKYRTNEIDRTQCLKIAKIVAVVNGWNYLGMKQDNQWTNRHTFKARIHYLQVDTETGAFEVYNSPNNHLGEMPFNTNQIKNPDSSRFIRL
ncbi:MAG: hypothetical protein DRI84_10585 [Bacteroidetes bacterium]|nr:MAG: hypothetical protein DRI84_10585 [Bacteroidota bacterium]